MLARMGRQNCRLNDVVRRRRSRLERRRAGGSMLLEELEKERTRIAQDLHAGAGQPLAGIKLNLELIENCSQTLPSAAQDAVIRLRLLTDQALAQVRAVSHRLHPPAWQGLTVAQALRSLVDSSGLSLRMEATVEIATLTEEPGHGTKVAIYRCAQECLSNISRHARATRIEVRLTEVDGWLELLVRDNGQGLAVTAPNSGGIGLRAIHEHAGAMGGTARVSSGPDGTSVTVLLPAKELQED